MLHSRGRSLRGIPRADASSSPEIASSRAEIDEVRVLRCHAERSTWLGLGLGLGLGLVALPCGAQHLVRGRVRVRVGVRVGVRVRVRVRVKGEW